MRFLKPIIRVVPVLGGIALFLGLFQVVFLRHESLKMEIKPNAQEIGITEHLGETLSVSEYEFKNEDDKTVRLGDYFNYGRPVLLTFVYYECPNLCNFMLNGLVNSLKNLDPKNLEWTPGKNFEIVTISIHPQEKPDLARRKKQSYLNAYGRLEAAKGWHFLTGEESQIRKLALKVGFGYQYDPNEKQYAHSAAIFVMTSEGKISRYLYGIEYPSQDLKLALLEASSGKIGSVVDRMLLFCYRYNPQTRKYSVYLTRLMQTSCIACVLVFGGYLMVFWRRQRKGA